MTEALLTVLKFGLLLLLYLFLARTLRAVVVDLYGPRRTSPPTARPAAATPAPSPRKSRKTPREIVVHRPDGGSRTFGLGGHGVTMGRSSAAADVVVDDVYVSDEHAQILPDDGGWSVRDLGSTNGTYLNGAKVTRLTPLADGDQLRLGKTRIEVRR
ncbi:FHA domain-containing protein [Egicoccus halophilus]|uniref:FHA domain-containing protein n=1 Tax=Egicoccus halophilus TaxID=1670830 RepID=A0A8J3EW78_9ACTN|nr:FHA domain-containing protein [Egicoccus halophilus]GGI02912.1 FHA domain-containing protein [Egicoccus halophilus]